MIITVLMNWETMLNIENESVTIPMFPVGNDKVEKEDETVSRFNVESEYTFNNGHQGFRTSFCIRVQFNSLI